MRLLRFAPILAAILVVPATASAHDEYDDDSYTPRSKPEAGVALDVFRSSPGVGTGAATNGASLGFHGRLGRRIALGLGLEHAFGDDPSGYRRYDIGWTLPKLYVFFNPKSKTQLYATTGMDMRVSHFENGPTAQLPEGLPWGHFYMGTFLGGGVEHRLDKTMSLRFEARWFARGRLDGKRPGEAALDPTFSDATRGYRGAVLSIGVVFY